MRLKPIMERLPNEFLDYNRLKIIFALLEYQYGLEEDSSAKKNEEEGVKTDQKRKIPEWMKKKNASAPPSKKNKKSKLFS